MIEHRNLGMHMTNGVKAVAKVVDLNRDGKCFVIYESKDPRTGVREKEEMLWSQFVLKYPGIFSLLILV